MQILDGQGKILCHGPVAIKNSQYGSIWAMIARHLRTTTVTRTLADTAGKATNVDIATDSFVHIFRFETVITCPNVDDFSNKLVSKDALEAHVTFEDFQIGVTDTSSHHVNQGVSLCLWRWSRYPSHAPPSTLRYHKGKHHTITGFVIDCQGVAGRGGEGCDLCCSRPSDFSRSASHKYSNQQSYPVSLFPFGLAPYDVAIDRV
mmetsp:Transcript_17815/g.26362  ORF Transcript_17815/g.26362 Transcript_17815/m.26362 type:complete len:204 (-) Transcript_17815:115-726(-)